MNTSLENFSFHELSSQAMSNQPLRCKPRIVAANTSWQQPSRPSAMGNVRNNTLSCADTNEMMVFLVDDEEAVCDALTLLIRQSNLKVESFTNAQEFLDICHPEMQGCAIIDYNMPGMNGIQLQEELIARGIPLPIIFLTGSGDIPLSVRAMKAGASDFLTKPVPHEKLLSSIRSALLESQNVQSQRTMNQRCQQLLSALTKRENDVMKLALEGQTSKKIANKLGISHRTVEIHKARLMKKTGAENILDLARIVQDAGISIGHSLPDDLQKTETSNFTARRSRLG